MAKNLNKSNIENVLLPLINAFQNDEKEKLNHLGNISKSLIEVRKIVKEEMEKLPPQFNVFNSINLLNHENYNSNLFANFLDIKFIYNGNEISFAKLFLKYLTEEFSWEFDLENIKIKDIEIKRELSTEERKRIDIFIGYKKEFAVIIENKIWAEDGYKQLENYYNHVKNNYIKKGNYDKIYIIYLTPYERELSEESLRKELYKKEGSELYGKFANIKHAEIGYWLEGILKRQEFSFLNNNEEENNKYNYKLLKSALIQIIDNEKSISGENMEGDMTNPKVEKVLEKELFQKIKNENGNIETDEIQAYIDMFQNQVIPLLKKKIAENRKAIIEKDIKPYLKFTKEVDKYLKSKGYKEGKDYNLLKDKDIINNMSEKDCYSHHIEFDINNIGVWLESSCNEDGSDIFYYFGIFTADSNAITKIIKKLKNSIKNIFNGFEYEYKERKGWIFIYYINIEKDNPQKIAEAMIDLYELLKKEIK